MKELLILGTRGIPAQHGGFETFAEHLALFLTNRNWRVTIYCQVNGKGKITRDTWNDITRINIPVSQRGAAGTVLFDLIATLHSLRERGLPLVLGYNTAIFGLLYRLIRRKHVINMDGIEWRRAKWGRLAKAWFYLNERLGCLVGNRLIADHPEIARHLSRHVSTKKISMIPYGADTSSIEDDSILQSLDLERYQYSLIVARPEPENSILELVTAFSSSNRGPHKLVILGEYDNRNKYHRKVLDQSNDNIVFAGAIYDKEKLAALRANCSIYFHGHTVGGTNPSLVEAMGAGCAVVAHDNPFNRWVSGAGALYYTDADHCSTLIDLLLNNEERLEQLRSASRNRFEDHFTWESILSAYESLLSSWQ